MLDIIFNLPQRAPAGSTLAAMLLALVPLAIIVFFSLRKCVFNHIQIQDTQYTRRVVLIPIFPLTIRLFKPNYPNSLNEEVQRKEILRLINSYGITFSRTGPHYIRMTSTVMVFLAADCFLAGIIIAIGTEDIRAMLLFFLLAAALMLLPLGILIWIRGTADARAKNMRLSHLFFSVINENVEDEDFSRVASVAVIEYLQTRQAKPLISRVCTIVDTSADKSEWRSCASGIIRDIEKSNACRESDQEHRELISFLADITAIAGRTSEANLRRLKDLQIAHAKGRNAS